MPGRLRRWVGQSVSERLESQLTGNQTGCCGGLTEVDTSTGDALPWVNTGAQPWYSVDLAMTDAASWEAVGQQTHLDGALAAVG